MQQPASTSLGHSSGLSWKTRNSSVVDGNGHSDRDPLDVEPKDLSAFEAAINMLIHEGINGISLTPSPNASNTISCSSSIVTEPNVHLTASEGTDVIVHEGFENIVVGSASFALGNYENELTPAELAKQITELKLGNTSLSSRVTHLEQDNASLVEKLQQLQSENKLLKSQIDQQQKECQLMKQISAELQLDVCNRDTLNENQRKKIVKLRTHCNRLQLDYNKNLGKIAILEEEQGCQLKMKCAIHMISEVLIENVKKYGNMNLGQIDIGTFEKKLFRQWKIKAATNMLEELVLENVEKCMKMKTPSDRNFGIL